MTPLPDDPAFPDDLPADLRRRRDTAPSREALRAHLVDARIAGKVATPREDNLRNFGRMSARKPGYLFGTTPDGPWPVEDVLALMAERCGVSPDPAFTEGVDTIDPDLTLARLDDLGDRLRRAVARRERVVVATGHPAGLLPVHQETVRLLAAGGCTLLTPAAGWRYEVQPRYGPTYRELRYVGGVGVLHAAAELRHTHSGRPMEAILAALADAGEEPPDLVVGDHGWAGAAGQAGVDAVGYADCNDPALFVAEAEGKVSVCVPLDDNVEPHLYDPLVAYLLVRATAPTAG